MQEMENFRDQEKEFKRKEFSKKALQHSNRNRGGSGNGQDSESDGNSSDYYEESDGSDGNDDGDQDFS